MSARPRRHSLAPARHPPALRSFNVLELTVAVVNAPAKAGFGEDKLLIAGLSKAVAPLVSIFVAANSPFDAECREKAIKVLNREHHLAPRAPHLRPPSRAPTGSDRLAGRGAQDQPDD